MSETPDTGAEAPQSAAARLFDLRSLIGGLFVLYGIMLTVAGFFTSPANLAKASHININLWMGIGMLVLGVFFLLWWRLRPLQRPQPNSQSRPRPGPPVTAPAAPVIVVGVDGRPAAGTRCAGRRSRPG